MRNRAWVVGFAFVLVLVAAWSANVWADDGSGTTAWQGFWNSVGGFFYNALPWNWGSWMGSSS